MEDLNIEFGCGERPRLKGYKTCDLRDLPNIDYVCKAWEIDQLVGENSVDNVFSRHFFEHLTFEQGKLMMKVWFKILKPGGTCRMMIPNLHFHVKQFMAGKEMEHALAGLFGWQRDGLHDVWDVHKSGYTLESIQPVYEDTGFIDFTKRKSSSEHLDVIATKPI